MEYPMKRKQFHMSQEDETILKDLAQNKGLSGAKIVREAVRSMPQRACKKKNLY